MKNLWIDRANLKKAGLPLEDLEMMFDGYMEEVDLSEKSALYVIAEFRSMVIKFCGDVVWEPGFVRRQYRKGIMEWFIEVGKAYFERETNKLS